MRIDKRTLICCYKANNINVDVDRDKCSLLDVIDDLLKGAKERGVKLPKYPKFSYTYRQKYVELEDDKSLLEMLDVNKHKVMYVWIRELKEPSKIWKDSMTLRPALHESREIEEPYMPALVPTKPMAPPQPIKPGWQRTKLPFKRSSLPIGSSHTQPQLDEPMIVSKEEYNAYVKPSPPSSPPLSNRRSPRFASNSSPPAPSEPVSTRMSSKQPTPPKKQAVCDFGKRRSPRFTLASSVLSQQPTPPPPSIPEASPSPPPSLGKLNDLASRRSPRFTNPAPPSPPQQPILSPAQEGSASPPWQPPPPPKLAETSASPVTQPASTSNPTVQTSKKQERPSKIPKTTAKRKGLILDPLVSASTTPPQSSGSLSRTRNRVGEIPLFSTSVSFSELVEDESDDEDYEPDSEEFIDDDETTSLEDEGTDGDEINEEDDLFNVVDDYEVNAGHKWFDNWGGAENYFDRMFHNGELYLEEEFGSIKLRPWMLFTDKKHFKMVFREYCIQEGFTVVVRKADEGRYTAECAAAGCPFRVHASKLPDGFTWALKSIHTEHNCTRLVDHNPMASYKWVAEKLLDDIRANNDIPVKSLNNLLSDRYGIEMKKSNAYNMKDYAMKTILGGHDSSYAKLPTYCEVIKETNPGSVAHCAWANGQPPAPTPTDPRPQIPLVFKYIFISFKSEFMGLIRGCRGLIGVDGTHLKGNYGGVLLSAVAIDGNNELFPVAHAIVENESKHTWSQFFWHLKQTLRESGRDDWTIISDRQKGVEPALHDMWPEVSRRYCVRHLCMNFKKSYPGPLMHALFWRVCNSYSEFCFNKAIERLQKEAGRGAVQWFHDLGDREHWARHKFDPKLCQDENTSNFVESFNALLGADRCKPVLTLLEGIRRVTMVRHAKRQEIAESWDSDGICPKIQEQLKVVSKDSRTCRVLMAGKGDFEIQDGESYLPLSLTTRTCACGKWQISGVPCKHAMKAINHLREEGSSYVSEWYSVKRYKEAYGLNIHPMPSDERWETYDLPQIEPPPIKRSIGRPSRNRRREEGEKRKGKRSTTVQCKKCKAFGHNSKTCKGGITAREARELQQSEGVRTEQRKRQRTKGAGGSSSQDQYVSQQQETNSQQQQQITMHHQSASQPNPTADPPPSQQTFSSSQPPSVGTRLRKRKASANN